jgi:16S rRNA (cytosine1402-N4)-methyltransferase
MTFHKPVMYREVLQYLITDQRGVYVDGTLGGGGHAILVLEKLHAGSRFIGIDQDPEALAHAGERLKGFSNISLHHCNFSELSTALANENIDKADGILLDLGVSSYQIDTPGRGFTYMQDGKLDMRMNPQSGITAADILADASEAELADIFFQYGEEKLSRVIARKIVQVRIKQPLTESGQLRKIIDSCVNPRFATKSYARVFQALRIRVNEELTVLEQALDAGLSVLKAGGRMVVIAYHSLEDRRVKTFFKQKASPCTCPPEFPVCVCGKKPELKILTSRGLRAQEDEISENSRARSAVLRVGEKI